MPSFVTEIPVRFGDIDYGGIVYYPRISHYLHMAFEDFFGSGIGKPYPEVFDDRRLGFPSVHTDIDFRIPLLYGDQLQIAVAVIRVGNSSLDMRYRIRKNWDDPVCVEALVTTCCIDMETFEAAPIPDDLREAFGNHIPPER